MAWLGVPSPAMHTIDYRERGIQGEEGDCYLVVLRVIDEQREVRGEGQGGARVLLLVLLFIVR